MSSWPYVTGVLALAGVIVPLALASRVIVRRLVPEWVGALACLALAVAARDCGGWRTLLNQGRYS